MKFRHLSLVSLSVLLAAACSKAPEDEANTEAQAQAEATQLQVPAQDSAMDYPVTRKGEVVDNYFDQQVADPYRWLEDDMSEETAEWVKTQNVTTFDYLEQIPYREDLKKRLAEMWNYERISAPFIRGDYT